MKNVLILFFLLFLVSTLNAQQPKIQFYPSSPTTSDSVMVVTDFPYKYDDNCSFIGFNNQKTGFLAGNEAVRVLKGIKAKYPKILIIASTM